MSTRLILKVSEVQSNFHSKLEYDPTSLHDLTVVFVALLKSKSFYTYPYHRCVGFVVRCVYTTLEVFPVSVIFTKF